MKKKVFYILAILLVLMIFTAYLGRILLPDILRFIISQELSKKIGAKVIIRSLKIESASNIQIFDIKISKKDSYDISIGETDVESNSFLTFFKGTSINCRLSDFKMSHKSLAIINGIASVLSMQPVDILDFQSVVFEISYRDGQLIFKDLNAQGDRIRILANGRIGKNDYVNYNLRLFLSRQLTDQIPQQVKEFLLKETGDWSQIDLYISGTAKKPSINLSTDLFKLILR